MSRDEAVTTTAEIFIRQTKRKQKTNERLKKKLFYCVIL